MSDRARRILATVAVGLLGLLAAVGIGLAANAISGDSVGLSAEPLSPGDTLAPAAAREDSNRAQTRRRRTRERERDRERERTDSAPAPPTATVEDDDGGGSDSSGPGSGGDDSSGRGRGRGRSGGSDD